MRTAGHHANRRGAAPRNAGHASGLATLMAAPPKALKAPLAAWVGIADSTHAVGEWARGLPPEVKTGFMPTQGEADAWAKRTTDGIINAFPMDIDDSTRIVLTSALATKVCWSIPLDLVPAAESPTRATRYGILAAVIGRRLNLPVEAVPTETFGPFGPIFAMDQPASSAHTRDAPGWQPTHASLLEDLEHIQPE